MVSFPASPASPACRVLGSAVALHLACAQLAGCAPPPSLIPDVRAEIVSVRTHETGSPTTHDVRGGVVLAFGTTRPPSPEMVSDLPVIATVPADSLALAMQARFAHEPDVHDVVSAALEASGLDPGDANDRVRRARRAALLPDLRLGATRQRGVDASSRGTTADTSIQVGRDDALRLEASLTFVLSRLAYGTDEIAWSRERRAIIDARANLVRDVVELFGRRRRLVVEIEILHEDTPASRIELEEVEALLEVFTNGNFSRMMLERARPP